MTLVPQCLIADARSTKFEFYLLEPASMSESEQAYGLNVQSHCHGGFGQWSGPTLTQIASAMGHF